METNNEQKIDKMLDDKKMLVGIFNNNSNADKAFLHLISKGYEAKEISIAMSESTRTNFYTETKPDEKVVEPSLEAASNGAAIGSTIGATIGTIIGVAVAIGSNVIIPGIGLLAAGPLIAGLAGAGTGVVTGGLIGALANVESNVNSSQTYEKTLQEGNILIGVHPKQDDKNNIETAWQELGSVQEN